MDDADEDEEVLVVVVVVWVVVPVEDGVVRVLTPDEVTGVVGVLAEIVPLEVSVPLTLLGNVLEAEKVEVPDTVELPAEVELPEPDPVIPSRL